MAGFRVHIYERQQLAYGGQFDEPVEFGRQKDHEPGPYAELQASDQRRVIVAGRKEQTISRSHVRVEPLDEARVRLTNVRESLPVRLQDRTSLAPGESCEVALPYRLGIGKRVLHLQQPGENESAGLQALEEASLPPGAAMGAPAPLQELSAVTELEPVVRWLQTAVTVLHSAAGSSDFFQQAARAAVDLVGLDSCGVLIRQGENWRPETLATAPQVRDEQNWQPSRLVLQQVCSGRKTLWQVPGAGSTSGASLVGVKAVVAAPILNREGEVIGILYGDRRLGRRSRLHPDITRAEAMLVELLASSIAAGLARTEQEKAALTARVQFEQFFTAELSRQLAAEPDLLRGRDAEVTILFADIRGFSRISERLGPARTTEWINDVLGVLSDSALAHQGVLVDYVGDEIMTMWGAPEAQPGHANLACQAALGMLAALTAVNERWAQRLGEPVALGIGVNSGTARVGNIGSQRKFKYGALGHTVDLASRVQGANKYFQTRLLVTRSTEAGLDASFDRRRLGQIRVVNIAEAVDLFEIVEPGRPNWLDLKTRYEEALSFFEQGKPREAAASLGKLLAEFPDDGPTVTLLARVVDAIRNPADEFQAVWQLPGK